MKRAWLLGLLVFLAVSLAAAEPKNNGKKKGKDSHSENKETHESVTKVHVGVFASGDHERIRHFYLPVKGNLPPGLAKRRGDLPPGLAKQLVRKGQLPPGLEKKLHPFPVELERTLPPLTPGTVRGTIGGHAVIFNESTRIILDVFKVF